MQNDQEEYSKAFNSDEAPMAPAPADQEVTEDNKNIPDESAPEASTETPAVAVSIDIPEAAAEFADPAQAEAAPESAATDVAAEAAEEGEPVAEEQAELASPEGDVDDGEQLSPEDMQRQKSWEGRLRKREEELAARESQLGQQSQASDAEIDEIKSKLSEDFGSEFVEMISKLAQHSAGKSQGSNEELGTVKEVLAQAINDVQEAFRSIHLGQIADAHEDFEQIVESEQFVKWLDSLPEEQRANAAQVIQGGRAGQMVKLLTQYKDSLTQQEQASDDEDAAYGVSGSSPVSLPTRVAASDEDEYKAAWNQM